MDRGSQKNKSRVQARSLVELFYDALEWAYDCLGKAKGEQA
jgi:hypothetical protein